jgi:hypothetical protein
MLMMLMDRAALDDRQGASRLLTEVRAIYEQIGMPAIST